MRACLRARLLVFAGLFAAIAGASADEGMWTFDNPPLEAWRTRYAFEPDQRWLDHLRLSSVRLSDGGSAAFVSPDGLLVTNQHVAASQLQKLSTSERNLVRDGFLASSRTDEVRCPDMTALVLVSFDEVTDRVHSAAALAPSDSAAAAARRSAITRIEQESAEATGLRSDVVSLYSGGEYWLYRYKQYSDVRIVFAPEEQAAYFGGDWDNFTFPRFNLDVAFLRVYENGRPARTEHYLRWSARGATDGDFVVLAGHPASTDRLLTMTQIRYQQQVGNPLQRLSWETRRDAMKQFAERGPEEARVAAGPLRSLENALKRLAGQERGLEDPRILERKAAQESALRAGVASNPEWQRAYGDAWTRIDAVYAELPALAPRLTFSTLSVSRLAGSAVQLVRWANQQERPEELRAAEYRGARLDAFRSNLLSPAPMTPALEEAILTSWLAQAQDTLGDQDPFVRAALDGRTPADVAREVVAGTRLADVDYRRALLDGEAGDVSRSSDPLLALARRVDPVMQELSNWQETRLESVETSAGQQIAAARFAVYGRSLYPDATFTLRLGFGRVTGYEEDTTLVPWTTTFYGLFDRFESFAGTGVYSLPERWTAGRGLLDLSTPLNFVYTADTIGGNSGSPLVNRAGELVGLNFDSNQQKLPNRYLHIEEDESGRAIGVHSRAILEALSKLYRASALIEEIEAARN
jgi:hypothetical protein